MEVKGQIGSGPFVYDAKADSSLNLTLSIGYQGAAATDPSLSIVATVPVAIILNALVAGKAGIAGEAEQLLVQAAEAYIQSQGG